MYNKDIKVKIIVDNKACISITQDTNSKERKISTFKTYQYNLKQNLDFLLIKKKRIIFFFFFFFFLIKKKKINVNFNINKKNIKN